MFDTSVRIVRSLDREVTVKAFVRPETVDVGVMDLGEFGLSKNRDTIIIGSEVRRVLGVSLIAADTVQRIRTEKVAA